MTYEEKKAWLRRYQQAKRLEQLRLDEGAACRWMSWTR